MPNKQSGDAARREIPTGCLEAQTNAQIVIDTCRETLRNSPKYSSEKEVGELVRKKIEEGWIERADVYVVAELKGEQTGETVEAAYQELLTTTGLESIDLILQVLGEYRDTNITANDVSIRHALERLESRRRVGGIGFANLERYNVRQMGFQHREYGTVFSYYPIQRVQPGYAYPPFIYEVTLEALRRKHDMSNVELCAQLGMVPFPKWVRKRGPDDKLFMFDDRMYADRIVMIEDLYSNEPKMSFPGIFKHNNILKNVPMALIDF